MKKRTVFLCAHAIRLVATAFTFAGTPILTALSMFTVPFLCATAFDSPKLSASLLIGYIIVFLLSLIFLFFKKTKVLGITCFAGIMLADLCTFVLSAFWGSNLYYLVGIPVCVIELIISAQCILSNAKSLAVREI